MRKGIAKLKRQIPRWKQAEFEELEYKPQNVKDLLTEMRDISEKMVDLAYSAIMYRNKEISEEVKYLEVRMDKLNYEIRVIAMLAARDKTDAEQLAGILQMAEGAETISDAAGDIASMIDLPETSQKVFSYIMQHSEETVARIIVSPKSRCCNNKIGDLEIDAHTGSRIIAIRREDRWIFDPDEEIQLREKDSVLVVGPRGGVEKLKSFLYGEIESLEGENA
jgi:uncharacterized protein with PhoU and TrkA domain